MTESTGKKKKEKTTTLLNNQMKSYKQDINKTLKNQQPAFTCIKLALWKQAFKTITAAKVKISVLWEQKKINDN